MVKSELSILFANWISSITKNKGQLTLQETEELHGHHDPSVDAFALVAESRGDPHHKERNVIQGAASLKDKVLEVVPADAVCDQFQHILKDQDEDEAVLAITEVLDVQIVYIAAAEYQVGQEEDILDDEVALAGGDFVDA